MAEYGSFNFFFDALSSLPASQQDAPLFFPPFESFRSSPPYSVSSFSSSSSSSASAFSSRRTPTSPPTTPPPMSLALPPEKLYPSMDLLVEAAIAWSEPQGYALVKKRTKGHKKEICAPAYRKEVLGLKKVVEEEEYAAAGEVRK
jgi:hypothetical protein